MPDAMPTHVGPEHSLAQVLLAHPWRAPLLPIALVATVCIFLDHVYVLPFVPLLIVAALALLGCWRASQTNAASLSVGCLWLALGAIFAAHHHAWRHVYLENDIGNFARTEPRTVWVRGYLTDEPTTTTPSTPDPLRLLPAQELSRVTLAASSMREWDGDWFTVSGKVQVVIFGTMPDVHVQDEIEVIGDLSVPGDAPNPGGRNYGESLRAQRIRAVLQVRDLTEVITRLEPSGTHALSAQLARLRQAWQRTLVQGLPKPESGIAVALLLGDTSALDQTMLEKYSQSAVIHVLAISGQHLSILALFLNQVFVVVRIPRRPRLYMLMAILIVYTLLVGAKPPVLRATVMVCVACVGDLKRQPSVVANQFSFAWLLVAILQPTDLFSLGCQLSFLAVALLLWAAHLMRSSLSPIDRLVESERPLGQQLLLGLGRQVILAYKVSFIIWVGLAPLLAWHNHLVSPVAILLSPPVTLITNFALVAGFLQPVASCLAWLTGLPTDLPCFWVIRLALQTNSWLIDLALALPGSFTYLGQVPTWSLYLFYPTLFGFLLCDPQRRAWPWLGVSALGWLCLVLLPGASLSRTDELRVTFLAVGHGGCTVLELPDGRVVLYDVGSMAGPGVVQQHIAPFLWSRGIRRIDELFISHADLDHFNGLIALGQRFNIGQVSHTPTFRTRQTAATTLVQQRLQQQGVPWRPVFAGQLFRVQGVTVSVLHPPEGLPSSNLETENSRSLVLLVQHQGHSILLTGDLLGAGLERLLAQPIGHIDVLMAPHHGSGTAGPVELAAHVRPQLVVSCQGVRDTRQAEQAYRERGARFYSTAQHGAITVRSHHTGTVVETFRTKVRLVIRKR